MSNEIQIVAVQMTGAAEDARAETMAGGQMRRICSIEALEADRFEG
jgi:hypothetical protein